MLKRMTPEASGLPASQKAEGPMPHWWTQLMSRPEVWHWLLYILLALAALLVIAGALRGT